MNSKSSLYKVLFVIPIVLFYKCNLLFQNTSAFCVLNDLFSQCIFDSKSIMEKKLLILAVDSIFVIVIFNLFFGMYIEKELSLNGVYIFSRIRNRSKWFYNKCMHLLMYSSLYTFLFVFMMLVICMISTRTWCDFATLNIFMYLWFALNFITFMSTLVINYMAIYYGEHVGFILVYMIMVVLMGLCLNFEKIPLISKNYSFFYINPMAAMSMYTLDSDKFKIGIVLYYIGISLLLIKYISVKISKLDISIDTRKA